MSRPTREDLELYVMGAADADRAAIEAHLAADPDARACVAEQARLELALREVARAVTFCPVCDGVVRSVRCDGCGAATSAGGFTVDEVKVQNAHGRLYLARDADGRRVALKELAFVQAPGAEALARFERETQFLRALDHPAIPRFVASFQEGEGVHTRLYLAQEYIDGEPLDRRLADHWFDEAEIVGIARQVLEVLVYLQKLSPMIVHRDIKPANVIRRTDGSIALVDFGAAYDQGATLGSTVVGTFGYMPVEQMAGIVDATTDPYALGASLLHLLTRREPWKILESPALGAANVSAPLRAFLHRLVEREPARRLPSAAAALVALDDLHPGATAMPPPVARPRWRRTPVVVVAVAVMAAAAGVAGHHLLVSPPDGRIQVPAPAPPEPAPLPGPGEDQVFEPHRQPDPLPEVPVVVDVKERDLREPNYDLAEAGNLNVVMPSDIKGTVTVRLQKVPLRAALEMVLKSQGLWYTYRSPPFGRIIRIAPQRQLDLEAAADVERKRLRAENPWLPRSSLPWGQPIRLDQETDLRNALHMIAEIGKVSLVMPDDINQPVTLKLSDVPWNVAMEILLEAHDLWYEYSGGLVRVAPRRQLDLEQMAEVERHRVRTGP